MNRILFIIGCIGLCSFLAKAQDSLMTTTLNDVVVTGQYEPQSIRKSVYQVRVISQEQIKAKGANNLQEVLNTELNFRFAQDLALGTSSVSMNGLSGQYVKVLLDGVPMVGRQGTENEINLNQININNIERVEIVEGPMAVAYGADAMAGVINVITKRPDEKISLSARVQEETAGKEYGGSKGIHNQYVGAGYFGKNFYVRGDAGRNYFGGWTGESTGREKDWHPKTQLLGSGTVGYSKDNTNIYYRLDALKETLENPGEFIGDEALDQKYITTRLMHQLQGEAKISHRLSYNGAVAFTDYERKTQSTIVNKITGRETLALGDGQQDVTSFTGLTVRGTFRYKLSNKISLQPGYDVNADSGKGGRLKEGNHAIQDYAAFVSAEFLPTPAISIRPGVRFEENSQYEAPPVIPSLNTKFKLSDRLDLRAAYGRGFRAPSLRELYFDFFDASHSIEGNPNLEAERSHSVNASLSYRVLLSTSMSLESSVAGFYNTIDNMINTGYLPGNSVVTTYINIDHFKSKGVVLNNTFSVGSLDVKAGFSYTGRYNEFEEQDDLPEFTWSPEVNTNVSYRFQKAGLVLSGYYKYTGKLPFYEVLNVDGEQVIHLARIEAFQWADVSAQKTITKNLNLTLGVKNLFDVKRVANSSNDVGGSHSTGGARPVGYGRSYFLSLNFQFEKLK